MAERVKSIEKFGGASKSESVKVSHVPNMPHRNKYDMEEPSPADKAYQRLIESLAQKNQYYGNRIDHTGRSNEKP